MTREQAKEMGEVLLAYSRGEPIEYRHPDHTYGKWADAPPMNCSFFWDQGWKHRIKPKPRKLWINEHNEGVLFFYRSKEEADRLALSTRIACHEIELPPAP